MGSKRNVDIKQFERDLKNKIELSNDNQNIDNRYEKYLKDLTSIIDKYVPITRRHIMKKETQNIL